MMKKGGYGATLVGFISLLLATGLAMSAVQLSPLAPVSRVNVEVIVRNRDTGRAVSGVIVSFDLELWPWEPKGDVDFAATTDSNGVARRLVDPGTYYLTLRHTDFESIEDNGPHSFRGDYNLKVTFEMVPRSTPIPGHTASFHLRNNKDQPIKYGKCLIGDMDGPGYATDKEGVITVHGLAYGNYDVRFWGYGFDFTTTFEMPSRDQAYTVRVDQMTIETGSPPPPPPPNPLDTDPVVLILFAIVGILGFFGFAILFHGQGPELVRMAIKR